MNKVVCQAITEYLFILRFAVINLILLVVTNDDDFLAIYSFVRLVIFINYVSSFYVYTLSSKLYLDEFKKLIQRPFTCR